MANNFIREEVKRSGVKFWEIAEYCGIADSTFCRQLRKELPDDKRQQVLDAIKTIAERKTENNENENY